MSALTPSAFLDGRTIADEILARLDAVGAPYKRLGSHEIEADLDGTGHKSWKINLLKGLWFCTDGSGRKGGIKALLSILGGGVTPAILSAAAAAAGDDAAIAETARREESRTKAASKWRAAWVCTHENDLPGGWDKGLNLRKKVARRVLLETARNRAYAYARERFYDPIAALRMGKIGRSDYGNPALVWPVHGFEGQLVGVQEVILPSHGEKTRLSWGPVGQGAVTIPAPTDVRTTWARRDAEGRLCLGYRPTGKELRAMDSAASAREEGAEYSPLLVLGEGVESTDAPVQGLGVPGFAALSTAGMVALAREWARLWAEKGAGKTPPCILIAVDRDESGGGQTAAATAATILRGAGFPVLLAVPPVSEDGGPTGGEKGVDWGDYPAEKIDVNVLRAHLAAQSLIGDELLADYLAAATENAACTATVPTPVGTGSVDAWVRAAERPTPPATTVSLRHGERTLRHALRRYAIRTARWAASQRDGKKKMPAPEPMVLGITTSTGKSHAVRDLIKHLKSSNLATLIVVPHTDDAERYEAAGAFYARGRRCEEEGFDIPWHCARMDAVASLSASMHPIAMDACHAHCEHGAAADLRDAKTEATQERARKFFTLHPEKSGAEPCNFLRYREEAREESVIVMVAASVGPSDIGGRALVIGDEAIPLVRSAQVDAGGIEAIRKCVRAARTAEAVRLSGPFRVLADWASKELDTLDLGRIDAILVALIHALTDRDLSGVESACAALREHVGTRFRQSWESPQWEWKSGSGYMLTDAPLRVMQAMAHYPVSLIDGVVQVHYPTPLFDAINKKKLGFISLDATKDRTTAEVVKALGGTVESVRVNQTIDARVDPSRRHAARKKGSEDHEQRLADDAKALLAALDAEKIYRGTDTVYALANKSIAIRALRIRCPWAEMLLKKEIWTKEERLQVWKLSIRQGLGWWHWHDRAHDEWAGWSCAQWDSPALPREALATAWETHRAALRMIDAGDHLPAWGAGEHAIGAEWVSMGAVEQLDRSYRPVVREIAEFRQHLIDAARIQGVGRGRGARHAIGLTILGGGPLRALVDEVGIQPRFERILGPTAAESAAAAHAAAEVRAIGTITRMVAAGETVTRRGAQKAARRGIGPTEEKGYTQGGSNGSVGQGSDTLHALIGKLADALAPALAARGRFAERRKLALERAATIPAADRAAVENALKSLLDQHVECDDLLTRMEQWWGDPRTATAAQAQVADIILSDDPPPVEAMAAS